MPPEAQDAGTLGAVIVEHIETCRGRVGVEAVGMVALRVIFGNFTGESPSVAISA